MFVYIIHKSFFVCLIFSLIEISKSWKIALLSLFYIIWRDCILLWICYLFNLSMSCWAYLIFFLINDITTKTLRQEVSSSQMSGTFVGDSTVLKIVTRSDLHNDLIVIMTLYILYKERERNYILLLEYGFHAQVWVKSMFFVLLGILGISKSL